MSNQVEIVVNQATVPTVVELLVPGPQGPGSTGGDIAAYVHSQPTPATTWTINHNLGHYPSVELFNTGMQEIDAEIAHPSVNQTVVTLKPATAGLARLI
jgi:hypothetical protein